MTTIEDNLQQVRGRIATACARADRDVTAVTLLAVFWVLRLGNGKQIQRAKKPATNPVAYLGRFFRQPRLIAGWLFAVMRSCGWWGCSKKCE